MLTRTYAFTQTVPVLEAADVVVCGGGPAGVAAALAARRAGRSAVLLERSAQLGGMGTLGGVAIFMGVGNVTGLYAEFCRELGLKDNRGRDWEQTRKFAPLFDPFVLRHYFNHKLEQAGARVYFHSEVCGVTAQDGLVQAVVASTREGLRAFEGRAFVDATGDARLAREAGVPCHSGREADGLTQPLTLMFLMQDTGKPVEPELPAGCPCYERVEDLPQGRLLHWLDEAAGRLLVNMTRVRAHAGRAGEASAAETEALKQVFGVADYLQRHGFATFRLAHVAAQTGVRETFQIEGLYSLTEDDLLGSRRFPDAVAQTNYGIDVHNPTGKGGTLQRELKTYDIPYRCLVPRTGPRNLIVAGRSISGTHVAMSSFRVMPTCFALGQAAGVAAALAVEKGLAFRDVPAKELQERLRGQGASLES